MIIDLSLPIDDTLVETHDPSTRSGSTHFVRSPSLAQGVAPKGIEQ